MALESALGISALVISFSVLMGFMGVAFDADEMSRAARAAARTIALNSGTLDPAADACAAIKRELQLAPGFLCDAEWIIDIDRDLTPDELPADVSGTLDAATSLGTGSGEVVLVRIKWQRKGLIPGDAPTDVISMGLARAEP